MLILSCWRVSTWAGDKIPVKTEPAPVKQISQSPTAPTAFQLPWSSLNGGGNVNMSSTNYKAKVTTGQSVIGESQSTNYRMGIGFWYGPGIYCLAKPGDVNASGGAPNLQDVIYLVNFVFDKSRVSPPCNGTDPGNCWIFDPFCRGDVNGSGGTPNLQDVIYLVNFVFDKSRVSPPCNGTDPGNCWTPVSSGVCCLPL